jgi:diguanylate cyclase (GGDEF)-like protein/PAS domain S-box-containing protein
MSQRTISPERAIDSIEALQAIIDVLATPVFVKDRQHRWVLANRALCEFMGRTRGELVGKSDHDFLPSEQADVFWEKDDLVFTTGQENENEEKLTDRTGAVRTIVTRKRLINVAGVPLLVAVITDVTAFREAEAHNIYLAHHDTLSGLANRVLLKKRVESALADPALKGQLGGLLMIDLDRFKHVNDAYGHAAGDELVREFAKRLTALLPNEDNVARLGGDEFVIGLFGTSSEGFRRLCSGVLETARQPFLGGGVMVHVSASIGVAVGAIGRISRSELLRQADVALYAAKSAGRNCCRVYDTSMDEGRAQRLALERDLRDAIATGQGLEVYYQPLFDGQSITGLEALVRWRHPERGPLLPAAFVPLAEETGLIVPLGDFVLDKACAALAAWPRVSVAVNVSAVQLRDPGLAMRVMLKLAAHHVLPGRLELEITETAVLSPEGVTQANLTALREAGIRLALDDFGTGYSSLSHLQNLKVDSVKIDQSFVSHLGHSSDTAPIVQAVVHLARMLNLKVTAEGVETEAQRRFLIETGCSNLQGFLLSPPLPEAEVAVLLASQSAERQASAQDAA